MSCRCDSGQDVTWQQTHREPVRIVQNDSVVDGQVKCRGDRPGCRQRALSLIWLHSADFLIAGYFPDRDCGPLLQVAAQENDLTCEKPPPRISAMILIMAILRRPLAPR